MPVTTELDTLVVHSPCRNKVTVRELPLLNSVQLGDADPRSWKTHAEIGFAHPVGNPPAGTAPAVVGHPTPVIPRALVNGAMRGLHLAGRLP